MSFAKKRVIDLVNEQSEDSSQEELINEAAFNLMVEKSLQESLDGQTVPLDDVAKEYSTPV